MLCINPFRPRKGVEYGCGQCRTCRVNKARLWTGRLILESSCHVESSFVTLTYAPEHLPAEGLSAQHWREFSKGIGFRYFGVGEYGDTHGRAHYHAILFGASAVSLPPLLQERWPYGLTQALHCDVGLMRYICRYTSKKYRDQANPEDKLPQFTRMSLRPGIGLPAMKPLADWLTTSAGAAFIARNRDVPSTFRSEGRVYPLGRYLVQKLRESVGLPLTTPELNEERRQALCVALEDVDFRAARERRREVAYDRAVASVVRPGRSF